MLETIKKKDIGNIINIEQEISLYFLFCDDNILNESKFLSNEYVLMIKKVREYSTEEVRKELLSKINEINFLFKNMDITPNLKQVFGKYINMGQEDIYGLSISKEPNIAMLFKTSDFGISLSYLQKGLSLDTISKQDWIDIELTFSIIYLAVTNPQEALIKLNQENLEQLIPINEKINSKPLKF